MDNSMWRIALLQSLLLCACASVEVDPTPDQDAARALIREASGIADLHAAQSAPMSDEQIARALADGLSLDDALRLALLNNARLQAGFSGLGVGRADFVQAGLLTNPSLGLGLLVPIDGGRGNFTADLAQSFFDLWQLPARQEVARTAIEQRILELSRFAGELLAETKLAYLESVAAEMLRETSLESAVLARSGVEALEYLQQAGAGSPIEVSLARTHALSAELVAAQHEREALTARRRLASLLSLHRDLLGVELSDPLPEPRTQGLDREALVARALSTRLDLRAAHWAVASADGEVELERRRSRAQLDVGASIERPERGSSVDLLAGPTASLELPIFDNNGAQLRRAQYRRDELSRELEALAAEVAQDVRAAVDRAESSARSARFIALELLPQAERGAELVQRAFSLGDVTRLSWLEAQARVLEARRIGIEAMLEAAKSTVEVERAGGASLVVLLEP